MGWGIGECKGEDGRGEEEDKHNQLKFGTPIRNLSETFDLLSCVKKRLIKIGVFQTKGAASQLNDIKHVSHLFLRKKCGIFL